MARQVTKVWREAASLIIVARNNAVKKSYDYNVLLFSRAAKASFMPSSSVFPGGVREPADESPLWTKYFNDFGVKIQNLSDLTKVNGCRARIFGTNRTNSLENEISLRITAIRETFEEVGVLFCRNKHNLQDLSEYGEFKEDFDRERWQHLVHNDPMEFLRLCKELEVIPDLWSLHEWSAWMTPSTFKKRFETAFYIIALKETPNVITESNEVANFAWKSPYKYLTSHLEKEIMLPPPQFYELSRLLNFEELENLRSFAKERSVKGSTLMFPVLYKCTDGMVALLPGDDMYPNDPDCSADFILTGTTIEEFRAKANKMHRAESQNLNKTVLQLNFSLPGGHVAPLNIDIKSKI